MNEVRARPDRGDRVALLIVVALAVAAAAPFVLNQWVYDDAPRILYDHRVQEWSGLWRGFTETYWPPPSKSGLYRPLAMTSFTLQWMLGGGRVLLFRVMDLVCYVAAVVMAWRLARRLFAREAAFAAVALFAVTPLHTEVIAAAVDQGESLVAALLIAAALLWLDLLEGKRTSRSAGLLIAACYLAALGFKENALILPGLLTTMLLVVPWQEAKRRGALRLLAAFSILGALWWGMRAGIAGDLAGAAAAEGLRGESATTRLVTMLGVVPRWARLFAWPSHLQSDYSPNEIDVSGTWGSSQTAGLLLLLAWGGVTAWALRRDRRLALGLLWLAIALFPVSNVLLPTGILLGERTLFLASVGVALILAALFAKGQGAWRTAGTPARGVVVAALGALLVAGWVRDLHRAPDWHDADSFVHAQLRDGPRSWRAHTAMGIWLFEHGADRDGEQELRTAISIWPHHARPYHLLADYYRGDGYCLPAMPLYAEGIAREPDRPRQRLSAVSCALWLGHYPEAAALARGGAPTDLDAEALRLAALTADSAAAAHAPVGTVRLAPTRDHATEIGWRFAPRHP